MALTQEEIQAKIKEVEYKHYDSKLCVAIATLENGFKVVGTASKVDPEGYDEKIGEKMALEEITDKVWELEGYLLQQMMYANDMFEDTI